MATNLTTNIPCSTAYWAGLFILPTQMSVHLLSAFMLDPLHKLTDTGEIQSYEIRLMLIRSLTIRWQETHNTTNNYTKSKDPNRRLHRNLSKPWQIFSWIGDNAGVRKRQICLSVHIITMLCWWKRGSVRANFCPARWPSLRFEGRYPFSTL